VTEADEFLASVLPQMKDADTALHNGNAAPRKATWSRNDPVTLFGAVRSNVGWNDIDGSFDAIAARFSNCTSFEVEVMAAGASGDLGYVAAIEHTTASIAGGPPEPYKLRVTTVFRRENGEWRIVHRHGDPVPDSDGTQAQLRRMSEDLDR
jgi:ketosteroid isomerase-like protein